MDFQSASSPPPNVVFLPVQQYFADEYGKKYARMPVAAIRAFSILSIIAGVASIGVQIAALSFIGYTWETFDVVGHGIWAGAFYVVSGGLGLGAASMQTKGLIVSTVVMASFSIASSIVASVLSGLSNLFYCYSYEPCRAWYSLEWALMGISIYAFVNSIVLTVLASVALCIGRPSTLRVNGHENTYFVPRAYPPGWQSGIVNPGFQTLEAPVFPGVQAGSVAQHAVIPHDGSQTSRPQQAVQQS